MTSPSTTDARRLGFAQHYSLLIMLFCFMIVLVAATSASAQTPITPTTNTVIFSDSANNDPASINTAPVAGIVMQGTAISAFTGQPVSTRGEGDGFAAPSP